MNDVTMDTMVENHSYTHVFGLELGIAIVAALAAPFVLWPIEQIVPYPIVIEELYKAVLVWLVLRGRPRNSFIWVFFVGLAFAVSETMVYLLNSMLMMDWNNWGWRWVTTVPMHVITTMIQFWGWKMGLGPLGIIPAILGHGGFNQLVR